MITNTHELYVSLHQLASFTAMFEAMYLDAKEKNDFTLFPVVSEGYIHKIRELNAEIREYLHSHSDEELPPVGKLPVRS
ncbi:MAG TPA: hypothetical protein VKU00_21105 [Chthonomonadaceae bacterium]|nr:hypothetical protein [Chthonomonadaceae bacterium]